MIEHGSVHCHQVEGHIFNLKFCTLPEYHDSDEGASIVLAFGVNELLARAGIGDCQIRVSDMYVSQGETEEDAHYRSEIGFGRFDQTASCARSTVPYKAEGISGLVAIKVSLPEGTPLDMCQGLGEQVLIHYKDLMDRYYGEDMPTTWGDIKVE